MPTFSKNTEVIENIKERQKRGERIFPFFLLFLHPFRKVATSIGFLFAGIVVKRSATSLVAFGCCNENGTVTELENYLFALVILEAFSVSPALICYVILRREILDSFSLFSLVD